MCRPEKRIHGARRGGAIRRWVISRESSKLATGVVEGCLRDSSARSAWQSQASGTCAAAVGPKGLEWLEEGKNPLDWNGPAGRIFTKFREEDLGRPIIDHFERVARQHRARIAVTDSDTSLS